MPKSLAPVLSAIERAKQLIEAEKAPAVMTRSSITDLANRVRQSEGQYGAQRVERAADEIPNLEKLYQDQALMRAFTGDNAQGLMTMKPSDFERYAAPLDANLSDRSLQKIADITGFHNNGGFSDVPYLNINKMKQGSTGLPYISGHEGRHRSRVMDAAGEQASLVQLVPRSELREPFPQRSREDYLEALYKEMQLTGNRVKPEKYDEPVTDSADRVIELRSKQRPAIELPDFYAQGGMVDSAPEEAIKNTIKDPQAFKMLDMDLVNLALMSQPQRMAGGGAVHMSKGSAVTDAAMAVEKAKRKLSAEAVERAAQRAVGRAETRAREEAEGYYHPIGGGNKLITPTSQMSAEYAPTAGVNMTPQQVINPEKMLHGASIPLVGDAAQAGVDLIGINGKKLSAPVTLQAGRGFARQNPSEGWKSHPHVISTLDGRIRDAYDMGAKDVYGAFTSMGPIAGDFNHMTTQALLRQFDPKTFKKASEFDNDMRTFGVIDPNTKEKIFHGKDFVGLHHPDLEKQLMDYDSGNLRKLFLNRAQMAKYQLEGMPDVASTRYGVNDPTMLNTPIGTVGMDITQFPKSDRRIITSQYPPHGTYPAGLYGDYVGGLEHPVSYKDWFHDFFDPRVAKNESPANENFAFMRSTPIQLHTQQWLDRVAGSIKKQQDALKLGEYAEGGAVHMEDGGDVELPTGGLSKEVGTNPLSIYNQNLPKPDSSLRMHPRRKIAPIDDGEPSTMDIARQLGIMAKEQAGEEWDSLKAAPLRGALDILNRGMVAGNIGAPVDLINMGLHGANYLTKKAGLGGDWAPEKPVMGSEWIQDQMKRIGATSGTERPIMELAANFLNPVGITAGAAKAAPVIGKNVLMPLAEKGLTMYERGQLTPSFKPTSEMFMGSKSQGADLVARDTAKARLAAGEDPALVWKETGWAAPPWAPNDLRFEISDHAMTSNAPAAVNAKLDAHSRRLANVYYAQEIKRNVASGDAFDDAVVKAEVTVKNAGLNLPMTPEAEALARDPNVTRAELIKEFDKGKVKKISTIGKLSGKLDKFVDHDEFFAAYPDFAKNIKFKTLNAKETNRLHGSFSPSDAEISMSAPQLRSKPNDALDTIVHELQHGVQSRERWNNGGNPSSVIAYPSNFDPVTAQSKQQLTDMMVADTGRLGDLYRKGQTTKLSPMEIQELNHRIRSTPEYSKYQKDALTFRQSDTPQALYERLAGEAEARLAQGRRTLKPNERQDQYPYDPQHFKKLTGYDINSIIANPVRASNTFSNGGAANFPSSGRTLAEGGIIDGHPIFQTAQVPFAGYRHGIGMAEGGQHFDEGGAVHMEDGGITPRAFSYSPTDRDEHNRKLGLPAEFYRAGQADPTMQSYGAGVSVPVGGARLTADAIGSRNAQMRDTLAGIMLGAEFPVGEGTLRAETMRPTMQGASPTYGLRYNQRFAQGGQVQRFDDGGEVSQSDLDRMKFELAQQQHPTSPVMQATPRSPIQDFIGTAGGYMDKAGRFVSEALEPIAESHPVHNYLGNMILAAPLKSAGTAIQDYTGTVRETDEENPVRGVISKNFRNLTNSTEPLLDPRVLDVAQFATPVVSGATKLLGAGAKAAAPFATKVDDMVRELHASGAIPQPGLSIKDVTPRVLAPANEQGFYSPTEAAALNLQRKTGNGQAFLNDLLKKENVRPDEIEAMGLDTWLKDKKNVTAAEVQDYIAQNKLGLGETTYIDPESIYAKSEALNTKIAEVASKYGLRKQQFGSGFVNDQDEFVRNIPDDLRELQRQYVENRNLHPKTAKFGEHSLPGGENYREVVLTLPSNRPSLKNMSRSEYNAAVDAADKAGVSDYQSTHWDEPNPLAHLRMSDRVTDGKKTLLVDEVQSDWHQAGRERGYNSPDPIKKNPDGSYTVTKPDGTTMQLTAGGNIERFRRDAGLDTGVPDAPYKEDWYQLALRRAVKEAIDGGYDRVALPTGARVNERFSLTKHINEIHYSGSNFKAYDHNGEVVISETGVRPEDLPTYVGKETANKLLEQPKQGTLRSLVGLDLQVGDKGNKKWYDEIYPGYLKKFGKKYGANVGKTTVDVKGAAEPLHYMDITPAMREAFKTGIHMKKGGKVSFADSLDAMRHELTKAK